MTGAKSLTRELGDTDDLPGAVPRHREEARRIGSSPAFLEQPRAGNLVDIYFEIKPSGDTLPGDPGRPERV